MFRANVRIKATGEAVANLCPGDLIGRANTAALRLADPRVSEAHALVSLRGSRVKLLALRGSLTVDGQPRSDVVLTAGMHVGLCEGVDLFVESVQCPSHVMALEGLGPQRITLSGSVYSVRVEPKLELLPRFDADAPVHLWSDGEDWFIQIRGGEPQPLRPDETFDIGDGMQIKAVAVRLDQAGLDDTFMAGRRIFVPLRIVARYDTVHLQRDGQETVSVSGLPARILSELVRIDAPVDWKSVANEIWRGLDDHSLRQRWDRNLGLLRRKLKAGGIRPGLVRSDGTGLIELVLDEGDVLVDQT